MSLKSKLQKSGDITDLNKKILEIKKKIQLAGKDCRNLAFVIIAK